MVFIRFSLDLLDNYLGKGFNPVSGKELGILTGKIDKYQCVSRNMSKDKEAFPHFFYGFRTISPKQMNQSNLAK